MTTKLRRAKQEASDRKKDHKSDKRKLRQLIKAVENFVAHCNEQERGWYSDGVAGLITTVNRIKSLEPS